MIMRTGILGMFLASTSYLVMLTPAQASIQSSIDIDTASFTISAKDLQITRDLIPLPPNSAWLELRRNSFRLSPIMGFAGKPIATARRVSFKIDPRHPSLALPKASPPPTTQKAALPVSSVPDPAPLGFLGLGLIALGLARRRKKFEQALPGTEKLPSAKKENNPILHNSAAAATW